MNVLFLTIGDFCDISKHGIYTDLLRFFAKSGHNVYVVCATEKRNGKATELKEQQGVHILSVKTGNITKTNFIEKGISTLLISRQYNKAISKYYEKVKFDLVLYSTPPITLYNVVKKIKNEKTFLYLMLKDIFPIGALDLGVLKKSGIKGLIYRYFRCIEKKLYKISDYIGCMSEANIKYVVSHNEYLDKHRVGLCPNAIDLCDTERIKKENLKQQYNIPCDKLVLIYGGNFSRPQGVDYIIKVLECSRRVKNIHFVMCGSGTDFYKIEEYKENNKDQITVINSLPNEKYRDLLSICDIGLIFLDYKFTYPNFPSRLLDYMDCKLPVLAATDKVSDIGEVITKGQFGWWCESKYEKDFAAQVEYIVEQIQKDDDYLRIKGENARRYLIENYSVDIAYNLIMSAMERWKD